MSKVNSGNHLSATQGTNPLDILMEDGKNDNERTECKWGPFKPRFCQRLANVKFALLVLCYVSAMQVI